jgi:hypothetical protein
MRANNFYFVLAWFTFEITTAFVLPQDQPRRIAICSSLKLVPGQGNQLVAAYNAKNYKDVTLPEDDNDDADDEGFVSPPTAIDVEPIAAAVVAAPPNNRNFVRRAFNLPSNMIRRHPHPKAELIDTSAAPIIGNAADDVVLYPLVGFTFCRNGDRVVALPTTNHVSCRLPISRKEEVYGWFSPVCKLDMYSEDPCRAPESQEK